MEQKLKINAPLIRPFFVRVAFRGGRPSGDSKT